MLRNNRTSLLSELGKRLRRETSFDLTHLLTKLGPHDYALLRYRLWRLSEADEKPST
jgi:hypothetical protein